MSELTSEYNGLYSDVKWCPVTLSERVKNIRAHLGYSQKAMSEALGINTRTWQIWEEGGSVPGGNHLESLVRLGFDANWILTGEGQMRRGDAAQQQSATTAQASTEAPIQTAAHAAFDALGVVEGMGLLTKIYSSGDQVFIRAINANLMAFGDAIENRAKAETTINAIREMREQMNMMQGDLATLRQENQELQRKLLSRGDREQQESVG